MKLLCTPSREWGPALVRHRELVDYVDGFVADPWVESGSHQYVNYGYDASMVRLYSILHMYIRWNYLVLTFTAFRRAEKLKSTHLQPHDVFIAWKSVMRRFFIMYTNNLRDIIMWSVIFKALEISRWNNNSLKNNFMNILMISFYLQGSHTTTDVSRQSWASGSGYTQNSHVSYESAVWPIIYPFITWKKSRNNQLTVQYLIFIV